MNTEELREKAKKAIDTLPISVLPKLVELLEELNVASEEKDHEEMIERIINEKRGLLARLAKD